MRIFTTLLLLTCSVFAFGKTVSVDTTFSINAIGPTTICGNDSVNIVATGCSGNIVWNNGTESPSIRALQSGNYFATCAPTSEISNTITVTLLPTPNPPTITTEYINTQLSLNANGCSAEVVWQDGSVGTSIVAVLGGQYFAFCRGAIGTVCISRASNIITVTRPSPMISANQTTLCNGERAYLSATACAGTISWSNGLTGTTIQISLAGNYFAYCIQNGIQSPPSNTIEITALDVVTPTIYSLDNVYCLHPTVTLTTNSCPEGNIIWSNGTTATSITVSVAGTYSAQCQNQCGTSPASNIVTVLANGGNIVVPAAPFISTTKTSICDGETTFLTAIGCNETIIWSNGATSSSITISQIGSYSAICQNQCSNSSASNIIVIQTGFMPTAPVISSNKTIMCDGESATLTASGCTGTVLWSTGATTNSIQLFSSGTYTAICQSQCGDSNSSYPIILRTFSTPTTPTALSNKSSICNGESAVLSATGCNGVFLWNNGATVTSISVTVAGTYSVRCQTICGNSAASNEVIIKSSITPLSPVIVTNKASICNAEIATLSSTGCFGNVVWSNGATGVSTQISKSGTYTALCENSCGTSTNSNSLIISQLSIQCTPISIKKVK